MLDQMNERIAIRLRQIEDDAAEARRVLAMNPIELNAYRKGWDRRTERMNAEFYDDFGPHELETLWREFFNGLGVKIALADRLASLPYEEVRRELS